MIPKGYAKGTSVSTPYGDGVVETWRSEVGICEIRLPYGLLYTNPKVSPVRKIRTPEQLNAAFESFEKMRKLNLEVECNELAVKCDFEKCSLCLLAQKKPKKSFLKSVGSAAKAANPLPTKKLNRCLLCSSPTCAKHLSKSFAKENVTLCLRCEELFHLKLDKNADAKTLQNQLDRFTDGYDRGYVLLQYMCQFIEPLVEQLNAEESTDDHVALGTSSVGFLAGAIGFAGLALIWTPAGAPLLLTSLVFSSSSTTVGLGYSAKKYLHAGPVEVANRIIAIYGILQSILMSLVVLREEVQNDPKLGSTKQSTDEDRSPYLEALSHGATATSAANLGFQVGEAAGVAQTGSLFSYLGFAPGIGTAFTVVMMASDLHTAATTLKKMHNGSKSEKIHILATIKASLLILPTSDDVEAEVQGTVRAVSERPGP